MTIEYKKQKDVNFDVVKEIVNNKTITEKKFSQDLENISDESREFIADLLGAILNVPNLQVQLELKQSAIKDLQLIIKELKKELKQ